MSHLVIAEKPSVAAVIAKVLGSNQKQNGYYKGNGYIVSWCIGHLVSLAPPESYGEKYKNWNELPVIPQSWNYELKENTKKQFFILEKLMFSDEVDYIVCATDAGREGELIFRHVYNYAGCKKPFKRLWISSLEENSVRQGFQNLKDSTVYDNLYKSALCRERADWLVGINATRLITRLYDSTDVLSIGRVQTPTLSLIVERDNEIANFQKEKYYTVVINCGEFKATSDKINDISEAKNFCKNCKQAKVSAVNKEVKTIKPPKLYDLTTLQREANRIYGFTAKQTLESLQNLYDNKLATYPRTDSRYLTDDMYDTAKAIIDVIKQKFDFAKGIEDTTNINAVIDNKKVSDHHAIIPTININKVDISTLTDTEKKILYLISIRLLSSTSSKHIYESTSVKLVCSDREFTASGKKILEKGYKAIEEQFYSLVKIKSEDKTENILPEIKEGDVFDVTAETAERFTKSPKPYTEDTLLSAMERSGNDDYDTDEVEKKGLGTPATRAAIIETLIERGYVSRNKKQLISTPKGQSIIKAVPDSVKSSKLTAEWENILVLISKGKADSNKFMTGIADFVKRIIAETSVDSDMKKIFNDREVIGICPRCKCNIYEGKQNFFCENKDCDFALWKNNKFFQSKKKVLTKAYAKTLLEKGRVHIKDLYSAEKNKNYAADIILDDTGKYINFKLDFDKK